MSASGANSGLQICSLVKQGGELELSLKRLPIPSPEADEVLIRVLAAPINPSDIGLMLGAADLTTLRESGTSEEPVVTAKVPPGAMQAMAGRVDQSLAVGSEGAGEVVGAGSAPEA